MATERSSRWQPDWAVPPGEVLLETLQERRITQVDLARRMNRPLKTVNEIINAKAALTPETAIQLELALGIPARFWNNLERDYREHQARAAARATLEKEGAWARQFPVKALERLGLLSRKLAQTELVAELLRFFQVSSTTAWEREWGEPQAAYRQSLAYAASKEAVAAWLRWGQIEAERVAVEQPYDPTRFRRSLVELRRLTTASPAVWQDELTSIGSKSGVVFLLLPAFPGTRLSGATQWPRPDRPIVQLSLRYRSDDQFWFSVFHEAGHVLLHRRRVFIHELDAQRSEAEQEADQFARDSLLPLAQYRSFVAKGDVTVAAIRDFAAAVSVAPGIVVGRLQRDGLLDRGRLNYLKTQLHWL